MEKFRFHVSNELFFSSINLIDLRDTYLSLFLLSFYFIIV